VRARGRCRAAGTGAGAQQQTRAASCQEPTEEAQHRLVLLQFGESRSVAMSVYARLCLSVRARISETDNESLQVFLLAKKTIL